MTRRQALLGSGVLALGPIGLAGYGTAVEPFMTPKVTSYDLTPPGWPVELELKIGVLADIHACEPWMNPAHIRDITTIAMALQPDLIVLLGDFNAGHRYVSAPVVPGAWAEALSTLQAPLGVYAILGNHDWWHGPVPGMSGGPDEIRKALASIRIPVLENQALRLEKGGRGFWLAGLADQMAHLIPPHFHRGEDDLAGTLRQIRDDGPVIMLAHEPFIFGRMPPRVALTLCGHTHGGQINLPIIGRPIAASRRYIYGHIVERNRHLIISAGLGESGLPIRIGVPPEILQVRLGGSAPAV